MAEATHPRPEHLIHPNDYRHIIAALETARRRALRHAEGDFSDFIEPTQAANTEVIDPPQPPWHRRLGKFAIRVEDAFYDKRDRLWAKVRGAFGFLAAKEAQAAPIERPVVGREEAAEFYDGIDELMDEKTRREVAAQVRDSYADRNRSQ
jgi:hypothetical protein